MARLPPKRGQTLEPPERLLRQLSPKWHEAVQSLPRIRHVGDTDQSMQIFGTDPRS